MEEVHLQDLQQGGGVDLNLGPNLMFCYIHVVGDAFSCAPRA